MPSEVDELLWKERQEAEIAAAVRRATPKRSAVIVFGRFNPPTTGHARVIDFLRQEAGRRKAVPIIFPSVLHDRTRNPLPFLEKVRVLRQLFPGIAISNDPKIRTPFLALAALTLMGFDAVWFVVGSDQTADFEKFSTYVKPRGLRDGRNIILKQFGVLTVPEARDARALDVSGMSGTKLRQAATFDEWELFRQGVPTKNRRLSWQLFTSVRTHMGLTASRHRQPAFLLYGTSPKAAQEMRESFARTIRPAHPTVRFRDVSGMSYVEIRQLHRLLEQKGYKPTIYVKEAPLPRMVTESWVKQQATYGLLRSGSVASAIVTLGKYGILEMVTHVESVLEAETTTPKQPTEVDRLKTQQKQEILSTQERQNSQLLQAKQRELQKKSREQQQKLANPGAKKSAQG